MSLLDYLVGLSESAVEHKELNDLANHRFFKEYKHDEPVEIASSKIEEKLRGVNPGSHVIRADPFSFVMVHPGGELITAVTSNEKRHHVATHYVSAHSRDFNKDMEQVKNGNVLYESKLDSILEFVGAVKSEYIVHDSNGKIFFRHKNPSVIKSAISHMQKKFFSGNTPHHSLSVSSHEDFVKKFGAEKLHEELNEAYHNYYTVKYSHHTKRDRKHVKKTFKINYAVDGIHANKIAHRIAKKRGLHRFRIHQVDSHHVTNGV